MKKKKEGMVIPMNTGAEVMNHSAEENEDYTVMSNEDKCNLESFRKVVMFMYLFCTPKVVGFAIQTLMSVENEDFVKVCDIVLEYCSTSKLSFKPSVLVSPKSVTISNMLMNIYDQASALKKVEAKIALCDTLKNMGFKLNINY